MTEAIRLVVTGDSKGGVKALGEVANAADKTQGVFGKYGAGLNKASNYAAVGVAALTGVIVKSVVTLEKQGAGIAALKREIDITTEGASILSGEFQRYGIEATTGGVGIKKLAQSIDEARNGSKTAAAVFERLGISVDQLKSMSDTEAILATRDALAEMGSGADRTNMAVKLLGRGALSMSAWYSTSAKDMAQTNKTLKDSGMVWSDEDLADYKKAVQAQREMQIALTGIQITIARDVVPAMTPMVRLFGAALRAVRPLAPVLVPATAALAAFVVVVKGAMVIQSAAGAVRGFAVAVRASRLATSGATLSLVKWVAKVPAIITANVGLAASYTAVGLAAAAAGFAIYEAIKAYQSWQTATNQAKATESAAATANEAAYKGGHITQAQYEANKAGIIKDAYQTPWYMKSPASLLPGFASGGDFIARGAQQIVVGDNPAGERVTVTPLGRKGAGVTELHVHNHFHGPVVGGKAGLRELTDIMNRSLGPQVDRLQRGRFAGA